MFFINFQPADFHNVYRSVVVLPTPLTDINDNALAHGHLFFFHLGYTDGANPLYNGNISQTEWKTRGDNTLRSYQYSYDKLNRLTEADYLNVSNNIADTYNVFIDYDKNGNITHLHRNGGFESPTVAPAIDQLEYGYAANSNQLLNVSDATNDAQGFKDGNSQQTGDDYAYDNYGNMIKDQNKGITHITYNHMNLPKEIDFVNNRKISYLYTAMGTKIQKTIDYGSHQVVTDYCDGYQYETKPQAQGGRGYAELLFFPTAEGYVKALYHPDVSHHEPKKYQYIYIYKDHLGNNRLSYTRDPKTGEVKILEENHYYPFGLKHSAYNLAKLEVKYKEELAEKKEVKQVMADEIKFKYLYQEQERQDELGLNWDSFKYRNYDYAIGRFMSVDPLAEKYPYNSTYAFQENKMGLGRELEGLELGRLNKDGTRSANGPTVENTASDATQGSDNFEGGTLDTVELTYTPKPIDGNLNLLYSQSSDQGESFSFVHADANMYSDQKNNVSGNVDILNGGYTLNMEGDVLNSGVNFSAFHSDITANSNEGIYGILGSSVTNHTTLDLATMSANLNWGAYNGANGKHGNVYNADLGVQGVAFESQSILHLPSMLGGFDVGYTRSASLGSAEIGGRGAFWWDNNGNFEVSLHYNFGLGVGKGEGITISNTNTKIHK